MQKKTNYKLDIKKNKPILVLLPVLLLILISILIFNISERPIKLKVTPDKKNVKPGDIITYTIKMGATKNLASMKFKIVIPKGLTFVSGEEVNGLKQKLNASKAEFTESTKVFMVGSSDYSSRRETILMTFKCSVNEDATGKKDIELIIDEDDFFDTSDEMKNIPVEYSNTKSIVNITIDSK